MKVGFANICKKIRIKMEKYIFVDKTKKLASALRNNRSQTCRRKKRRESDEVTKQSASNGCYFKRWFSA